MTDRAKALHRREIEAGFEELSTYADFAEQVKETKRKLLDFLIQAKRDGKSVAGYGAPGKGNTLLNYCGIRTDFLDYTVDRNPYKQGMYLPGTRIPIYAPDKIRETRPDYVLILPWNFKDEIMEQMADIRSWGGGSSSFRFRKCGVVEGEGEGGIGTEDGTSSFLQVAFAYSLMVFFAGSVLKDEQGRHAPKNTVYESRRLA